MPQPREDEFDGCLEMARSLIAKSDSVTDAWEANQHVNRALALRPADTDAWVLKAQILGLLGDDVAALAAAEMAVRRAPRASAGHHVRATALATLGRYREALRAIERALDCAGGEDDWILEELFLEKSAIQGALGRCDEALATLEAGLVRCPSSILLRAGMAPLHRERVRRSFRVLPGGLKN